MLPAEQDGQPDPEPVLGEHVPTHRHGFSTGGQEYKAAAPHDDGIVNHLTGKAVVGPGHDGLQINESNLCSIRTVADEQAGTATTAVYHTEKEVTTSLEPRRRLKKRKRLALLIVTLVLVSVIAAVAGGVLGSRKAGDGSMSSYPSSPSPKGNDTSTPSLIKRNSSLSVTAWRKEQGLEIFLYYQEVNGGLRYSTYDDTQSTFAYNGSYWGKSREIDMDSGDAAADDASLTATIVLWGTESEPQVDLFYLNPNASLRSVYFMKNADAQYYPWKSFNNLECSAATGSYLAGYWPYFARIDVAGEVAMWRNSPYSEFEYSQTESWTMWNLSNRAMTGSRLAVVPLGPNITSLAWWGNYGVFYQDIGGKLSFTQPSRRDADNNGTLVDSWPTDAYFPHISLAAGASFAAFTTARQDSREGFVNTYVLYQETSTRISMVYLDNSLEWAIKQPEVLSIADVGTDITCITMPMTQNDVNGKSLDLEEASVHYNRCYFQRDGHVIEFALNGTDWIELGTVPID